jgi:hypothetical protein
VRKEIKNSVLSSRGRPVSALFSRSQGKYGKSGGVLRTWGGFLRDFFSGGGVLSIWGGFWGGFCSSQEFPLESRFHIKFLRFGLTIIQSHKTRQ